MISSWLQDPSLTAAILATMLPFVAFLLIMLFARSLPTAFCGTVNRGGGGITFERCLIACTPLASRSSARIPRSLGGIGRYHHSLWFSAGSNQSAHALRGGHDQFFGPGLFPWLYGWGCRIFPLLCLHVLVCLGHDELDLWLPPCFNFIYSGNWSAFHHIFSSVFGMKNSAPPRPAKKPL